MSNINKPDSISQIWFDEDLCSPEPWRFCEDCIRSGRDTVVGGRHQMDYTPMSPENMRRATAAVNFCREFDTAFLEKYTLRYLDESEASVAMALPLQPGFVGLIACFEKGGAE